MMYLYGLLQPENGLAVEDVLDRAEGVSGRVSILDCEDLVVLYSPHDGSEILPRRKSLLSHARVLEAAMAAGTVLPMRFGMTCRSTEEFARVLRDSDTQISRGFDRVRGRVEIGVRVTAPDSASLEAAVAASPELNARRDRLSRQGNEAHFAKAEFGRALGDLVASRRLAAQKALMTKLKPICVEYVLKAPETDFETLRAEVLIEEDGLSELSSVLECAVSQLHFAKPHPCSIRLIGPGPAFHFVDFSLDSVQTDEVA